MQSGDSNSTTNSEPWGPAQQPLQQLIGDAYNAYQSGPPQIYPHQMYLDPNSMQQQGMQDYGSTADAIEGMNPALFGAYGSALSGDNALTGAYGGSLSQGAGVYSDIMNRQGYGPGWSELPQTAATSALASHYGGSGNPYLEAQIQQGQSAMADTFKKDVLSRIQDDAVYTGNYGGSAQHGATMDATERLMKQMGEFNTSMRSGNYQADQNRALTAATTGSGMEFNYGRAGVQDQQALDYAKGSAAGQSAGIYGEGLDTAQSGMLQSMALTPTIHGAATRPGDVRLQQGGMYAGYDQMALDENMFRFNNETNGDRDNMAWLGNILGFASPYGSSSTVTNTQPNPYSQLAGLGMMGYGMFSGNPAAAYGGFNMFGGGTPQVPQISFSDVMRYGNQ